MMMAHNDREINPAGQVRVRAPVFFVTFLRGWFLLF